MPPRDRKAYVKTRYHQLKRQRLCIGYGCTAPLLSTDGTRCSQCSRAAVEATQKYRDSRKTR